MADNKQNYATSIVGNAFKGFILGQIQNLTDADFYALIQSGEFPPLLDIQAPKFLVDMGIGDIIANNKDKIMSHVNVNSVIELANANRREDLAVIIETEEGYSWMERFLKLVKFIIETIEMSPVERKREYQRRISIMRAKKVPVAPASTVSAPPQPSIPVQVPQGYPNQVQPQPQPQQPNNSGNMTPQQLLLQQQHQQQLGTETDDEEYEEMDGDFFDL